MQLKGQLIFTARPVRRVFYACCRASASHCCAQIPDVPGIEFTAAHQRRAPNSNLGFHPTATPPADPTNYYKSQFPILS